MAIGAIIGQFLGGMMGGKSGLMGGKEGGKDLSGWAMGGEVAGKIMSSGKLKAPSSGNDIGELSSAVQNQMASLRQDTGFYGHNKVKNRKQDGSGFYKHQKKVNETLF